MHHTFSPPEVPPSRAVGPARFSRLKLVCGKFNTWLQTCADKYAQAAAYENLSRLSDAELRHRSLSRDILYRDLNEGNEKAFEQPASIDAHRIAPALKVITMPRSSYRRDAKARAFQTAAMLLILLAVLALLVPNLVIRDTTHTATRDGKAPTAGQPAIDRF